jgi:hypothetical protein
MPSWLGTLIALALVGAMVVVLVLSMIRAKKRGSGCSCGCSQCKFNCPSRQENEKNSDKTAN